MDSLACPWPISSTAATVADGFAALQDNRDIVDAARCTPIAVPVWNTREVSCG
jgi:hypothetical protein